MKHRASTLDEHLSHPETCDLNDTEELTAGFAHIGIRDQAHLHVEATHRTERTT
jgi:hypothetical protein